jgi:hypothetical protein
MEIARVEHGTEPFRLSRSSNQLDLSTDDGIEEFSRYLKGRAFTNEYLNNLGSAATRDTLCPEFQARLSEDCV